MIPSFLRALLVLIVVGAGASLAAAQKDAEARMIGLFDRIDTNHDGVISLKEFEDWRAHMREHGTRQGSPDAVDAHLTMNQIVHGAGPASGSTTATPTPTSTTTPPAGTTPRPTRGERAHRLFERIDTNHDGKIERDEWIAWVRARMAHRRHHAEAPVQPGPVLPTQGGTNAGTAGSAPSSAGTGSAH